jgi:hypothetical protein
MEYGDFPGRDADLAYHGRGENLGASRMFQVARSIGAGSSLAAFQPVPRYNWK